MLAHDLSHTFILLTQNLAQACAWQFLAMVRFCLVVEDPIDSFPQSSLCHIEEQGLSARHMVGEAGLLGDGGTVGCTGH